MAIEPYLQICSLYHKEKGLVLPPAVVDEQMLQMFNEPDFYMVYAAQQSEDEEELERMTELGMNMKETRGVREEMETLVEKAIKLGIKVQRALLPLNLPKEVQEAALEQYGGPRVNQPKYYYRLSEAGGYQIIQYWFFYAYNDFATSHGGVNDHEADWEQITLYLKGDTPEWALFASHDARGETLRKKWKEIELVDGHPVVYPGVGSHAAYFTAGEHGGIDTANGNGLSIGTGDMQWNEPGNLDDAAWATDYAGLWGYFAHERISDKLLMGAVSPAGPKYNKDGTMRLAWENPLKFAELE